MSDLLKQSLFSPVINVSNDSQLVEDLVNTTESYRALKIRVSKHAHEMESWQGKASSFGIGHALLPPPALHEAPPPDAPRAQCPQPQPAHRLRRWRASCGRTRAW